MISARPAWRILPRLKLRRVAPYSLRCASPLANRLFAVMTAMLEDTAETAAGKLTHAAPAELAAQAHQIQAATHDVAALAKAVLGSRKRTLKTAEFRAKIRL